jgi:predicted RNA-binding protein YlxR (DUF448 family)
VQQQAVPADAETDRASLAPVSADAGQSVDEGDAEEGPLRRCIATGDRLEQERMIRFVVGPEDRLYADVTGRLPGKGIWVTASREALERAVAKRLFARAARRSVEVGPDLPSVVDRLVERQCLDVLGLARRAGALTAGFEKVDAMLRRGPVGALIEAADGAADGCGKLRTLAGDARVIALLPGSALADAIGRDGIVVHAAIARGKLAERFIAAADRLAGLRGLAYTENSGPRLIERAGPRPSAGLTRRVKVDSGRL